MDLSCCDTTITSLSEVPLSDDCVVVFDLDDTLYAERDFVRSGFRAISRHFDVNEQTQVFRQLVQRFDRGEADPLGAVLEQTGSRLQKKALLRVYREHPPEIKLALGVQKFLDHLKSTGHRLGLLTDGRSITQRNKIEALGLRQWVSEIVISEEFGSEKPNVQNYQHFEAVFDGSSYAYVGDNLTKDFVAPNRLGWMTIARLDQGENIHPQRLASIAPGYGPQFFVREIA